MEDFNTSFLAHQITERCRLIALADCDDVTDGNQHYITFQAGNPGWIQHSEPKRHHTSRIGKELPNLYRETAKEWRPIDRQFAENLLEKTRVSVLRVTDEEILLPAQRPPITLLDQGIAQAERGEILQRTSELVSPVFGLTLVLVGTP